MKTFMDLHNRAWGWISCCGHKFSGRSEPYEHMRYHLNPDVFKCPACGKGMMCGRHLDAHKMDEHEADRFQCNACGKGVKGSTW